MALNTVKPGRKPGDGNEDDKSRKVFKREYGGSVLDSRNFKYIDEDSSDIDDERNDSSTLESSWYTANESTIISKISTSSRSSSSSISSEDDSESSRETSSENLDSDSEGESDESTESSSDDSIESNEESDDESSRSDDTSIEDSSEMLTYNHRKRGSKKSKKQIQIWVRTVSGEDSDSSDSTKKSSSDVSSMDADTDSEVDDEEDSSSSESDETDDSESGDTNSDGIHQECSDEDEEENESETEDHSEESSEKSSSEMESTSDEDSCTDSEHDNSSTMEENKNFRLKMLKPMKKRTHFDVLKISLSSKQIKINALLMILLPIEYVIKLLMYSFNFLRGCV